MLIEKMTERIFPPEATVNDWLDFYSSIRLSTIPAYEDIFLNEFLNEYRNQLIIILDEFPSAEENNFVSLYILNFLRYLNLSVLMMGTNTKISNPIGNASGSSPELTPWNELIYKLPQANIAAILASYNIGQYFQNYGLLSCEEHLSTIIQDSRGMSMEQFRSKWCVELYVKNEFEARAIRLFKVLINQMESSRPGIAIIIASVLSIVSQTAITLESNEIYSQFIHDLFAKLCHEVCHRKWLTSRGGKYRWSFRSNDEQLY